MPTIPSIRTAVENQSTLLLDKHAKNGIFQRDARGRLIAYAGGFSVVFPYETANKEKWAFRCWHSEVNNSKRRYEIISEAIQNAHLHFLCNFEFIEKGINVEGKVYPITRMRWIDGITIKDFICQNRYSKHLLMKLADKFLSLTHALHNLCLAHGDLQHGNILVSKDHEIYLVDYDSFYCPKLKGEADNVTGLPDYQHPARIYNQSVSEKLDYFSELIIYLSILAIAEKPTLIDKYKVENADRLLFAKEDFTNIKNAPIYKDISSLGTEFQDMLAVLEDYLVHRSIDDLDPFDLCLASKRIKVTLSKNKIRKGKESAVLSWNTDKSCKKIEISENNTIIKDNCAQEGSIQVSPTQKTDYKITAYYPNGKTIVKLIQLEVFEEAFVKFTSDKSFVFPHIPITLSWETTNSKSVRLMNKTVPLVGTKNIEEGIEKETVFVLKVEDEFGTKEYPITIRMLPIPQIKAILVPTPEISTTTNVTASIPIPSFKIESLAPKTLDQRLMADFNFNIESLCTNVPEPIYIEPQFDLPTAKWWQGLYKIFKKTKNK